MTFHTLGFRADSVTRYLVEKSVFTCLCTAQFFISAMQINVGTVLSFETNYFTRMCSDSEAGSYFRFIDFVYHSTRGLRVEKEKE